ncbi:hypothetical protein A2954_03715 [Candidatus Roizmanbacteria bacterium RIFCSPLOWO2_01_FULL_37_12]|uniref:Uncharacterized protein n=1 Tax=Candidatus Roizmanbacteria bacterium RIFCSPLOWO2_01_FULL_37_12 TaxID=1802056 RepID=A0A1F7IEK4_9BACT|nr:MAG: hypothetical protein A3D76_04990 [Candidatus Roizmanbacteria bacterium RIFCSPHIGHO2_02_FULL_37_9b]OGK41796.1 MAG: hypothetical protein A2954_03715 [Candidatus Roizmanbacteria bacterium RIFCSPLOWO2_01_FULL_37_12]
MNPDKYRNRAIIDVLVSDLAGVFYYIFTNPNILQSLNKSPESFKDLIIPTIAIMVVSLTAGTWNSIHAIRGYRRS